MSTADDYCPENCPTMQELIRFRERYGLEAYLIWCCAFADLPVSRLMNLLRIGRYFGSLPEDRFAPDALSELVRRPLCSAMLAEIAERSARGRFLNLDLIEAVIADHG